MPRELITADLHFGDSNMLKRDFVARPYASVRKMDDALIRNWNRRVGPNDVVWVLGDVFGDRVSQRGRAHIFNQLNGEKHLIVGNHDDGDTLRLGWASVQGSKKIDWWVAGVTVSLSHYPPTKPGLFDGRTVHLHGHLHCKESSLPVFDVGVDGNRLRPWRVSEIGEQIEAYVIAFAQLRGLVAAHRRAR